MAVSENAGRWGFSVPIAAATISAGMPYIAVGAAQTAPQQVRQAPATTGAMSVDEKVFAAEMRAAEAKTDSKFAQFMGELRAISVKIDQTAKEIGELKSEVAAVDTKVGSTKSTIIATIIGAAIGIVGLTFAAVAIFQSGMGLSATAYQAGVSAAEAKNPSGK